VECEADESIHLHNAFAYQQEPAPAAHNVFTRDLRSLPKEEARQPSVALNGASANGHGHGSQHPPADRLPDVASRPPQG
jgi:hypothetical protein